MWRDEDVEVSVHCIDQGVKGGCKKRMTTDDNITVQFGAHTVAYSWIHFIPIVKSCSLILNIHSQRKSFKYHSSSQYFNTYKCFHGPDPLQAHHQRDDSTVRRRRR